VVLAIQLTLGINCDIFDRITETLAPLVVVFWFNPSNTLVISLWLLSLQIR
jgi:hypothetical protein